MAVRRKINANKAQDWAQSCGPLQSGGSSRIIGRGDFLFAAGAMAVIAGFLFPPSAHALDVLLIFSISLTAAALIITFSVRRALQVLGFPLLILLATMLRITVSVAASKLIHSQADAGAAIDLVGTTLVSNNCTLAILAFGTLIVFTFAIICMVVKSISHTAADFTAEIVPIKQTGVDLDLKTGIINENQARLMQEKIAREAGFFHAMAAVGRFILCAAVIELVIIIINMAASTAQAAARPSIATSITMYTSLTVGTGIIIQISALLAAVAAAHLVRKSYSPAADDRFNQEEAGERINVVSTEVAPAQSPKIEYDNGQPGQMVITKDLEWLDQSENAASYDNEKDHLKSWLWKDVKDTDYYDAITDLIESKSNAEAKTILTAAQSPEELGVTIPVNIAIRLAQKGQRCLLIDMDRQRNAISKVFDIDLANAIEQRETLTTGIATCIDNLWVWPASLCKADTETKAANLKKLIAALNNQYDRLVLYVPNINLPDDWDAITALAQTAVLFGEPVESDCSPINDFRRLLAEHNCRILKPTELSAATPQA